MRVFIFVALSLIIFSFSSKSFAISCIPTCSSTDARFLSVTEGLGTETFSPGFIDIRVIVPGDLIAFSFGIFDGNAEEAIDTIWDLASVDDLEYSYTMYADPDGDNTGPIAFQVFASDLGDNIWQDFPIFTDENARDANGDFVYNFRVMLISPPSDSFNSYKLRSTTDGVKLRLDGFFGIIAPGYSLSEFEIIYPNVPDLSVTTYDGTFTFYFDVEGPLTELEMWDADFDYGDEDGIDQDTDDPNTPNTIPSFDPPGSNSQNEGANCCAPFDDRVDMVFLREGNIKYKIIAPDGQEFINNNPSGNREWELFNITTEPGPVNTSLHDLRTDSLPPGRYTLIIEGMDISNHNTFFPPFALIGEEDIEPPLPPREPIPTLSEWGYIIFALFSGLIGIWYIRKRAYSN